MVRIVEFGGSCERIRAGTGIRTSDVFGRRWSVRDFWIWVDRGRRSRQGRQRYEGKSRGQPGGVAERALTFVLGENEPFGLSPWAFAAGTIHSVRGWAPPIDAEFRKCLHLHHPMPTAAGTPTGRPSFL